MNATAGNGNDDDVTQLKNTVTELQADRARLFAEVSRLRTARNEALVIAATAQQENARLLARIAELEGNQ
jgi:hypothetical protein